MDPHVPASSRSRRRRRTPLIATIALALAATAAAPATAHGGGQPATPNLGPNVVVFDPSMPVADIQAKVDQIHAQQVDAEMGTARYSLLFKPGEYGTAAQPLQMKVGYYTEVAGLGASPTDESGRRCGWECAARWNCLRSC